MKKYYLLLVAAFIAVTAFAQQPQRKSTLPGQKALAAQMREKAKSQNGIGRSFAPRKASEDDILVEPPAEAVLEDWTFEGSYTSSQDSEDVQKTVQVAIDGNDFYLQGLAYYFPEAWVKGTINGGEIVFESGQFVGEDKYGTEYMIGSDDGETICDIVFNYDSEASTISQKTSYILENGDTKEEFSFYGYWRGITVYAGDPIVLEAITLPDGLETETYLLKGLSVEYDEGSDEEVSKPYEQQVQVGFDGDDVYFVGLSADYAEGVAKATKNGAGQYVIPANQYMGTYDVGGYGYWFYDFFFTAVDPETGALEDVVFDYDEATNTFSTNQTLALNGSRNTLYYYLKFNEVTITKMLDVAATPATPSVTSINLESDYPNVVFNVPATGTNGETLLTTKLFYQIWTQKAGGEEDLLRLSSVLYPEDFEESVVEIPYDHDGYDVYRAGSRVYLNQDQSEINSWLKIGVQSIYYGGDERNESEIDWYTIKEEPSVSTAISELNAERSVERYDLQGRMISGSAKGISIEKVTLSDGTVKTVKVVRK